MIQMFILVCNGQGSRPLTHRFSWSNVTRYGLLTFMFQHALQLWLTYSKTFGAILGQQAFIQFLLRYSNLVHLGLVRYDVDINSRSLLVERYLLGTPVAIPYLLKSCETEMLNKANRNRLLTSLFIDVRDHQAKQRSHFIIARGPQVRANQMIRIWMFVAICSSEGCSPSYSQV